MHGSRATVAIGSSKQIPLPNGYCNLIVAGRLPTQIDFRELARVLNPNGVAVIGGPDADAGKLKSQAAEAGLADGQVEGTYLVIRGKMPAGSDDWSHFCHGPDNNPVSTDASIRPPFRTQWIAPGGDVTLAAKGRVLYKKWGGTPGNIVVKDGMNGTELWTRDGRAWEWIESDDTLMVGDRVYALDMRNNIAVLDAATGKELATFKAPAGSDAECFRLFRIAFQDGVLYAVGEKKDRKYVKHPVAGMRAVQQFGDRFFALDAKDGRLLWVYKADEKPLYQDTLALGPEAAFFVSDAGAVAVDLKTGKELWRNPEILPGVAQYLDYRIYSVIYQDGRVHYLCAKDGGATLDGKTGALAYSIPGLKTMDVTNRQLCIGNTLYAALGHPRRYVITPFDNATGRKLAEGIQAPSPNGCKRLSGTPACIGGQFGYLDLKTQEWFCSDAFRISCKQVVVFANGLGYKGIPLNAGRSGASIHGATAIAPAGSWRPPKASDAKNTSAERLRKGPAYDEPLAAEAGADDWPYYRHDAGHSACAKSAVKLPAGKGWQQNLCGKLTPVSVAAGMVFAASDDGHVWALDAASGEVRWTYLCGNAIKVTPTYWKGRLFVGSADGCVYCLEASTGKLAWRFQASPQDRFASMKGRLYSAWPILGGVVVDDDTAYFTAGMCTIDGVYLYAVSAVAGQVRWVREIGHLSETMKGGTGNGEEAGWIGINPYGALAMGRDLLYVPNGGVRLGIFKKTDGEVISWQGSGRFANTSGRSGGGEVVVAGEEIFTGGGTLLLEAEIPSDRELFRPQHASSGEDYAKSMPFALGDVNPASTSAVTHAIKRANRGPLALIAYDREKLTAVYRAPDKDKPAAETAATLWTTKSIPADAHSLVLAGPHILVAGSSEVVVLDETGQKELARFKVKGRILRNGLSVVQGKAYVVIEEGGVVCIGNE